jgi:hypothetical protein
VAGCRGKGKEILFHKMRETFICGMSDSEKGLCSLQPVNEVNNNNNKYIL